MYPVSRAVKLFALSISFTSLMAAAQSAPAGVMTAGPARDGIRVTAGADIVHTRVQAFTSGGSLLYDSGWRDGNVLDWPLQDSFGHVLAFDSYGITVMARDVAGHVEVRNGTLHFAPGDVRVDGADLTRDGAPAMVRLAHTGAVGQIVTTEGALSFRFGDFLAGNDVEALRLSPAGDLEVAGMIHAARGIQFADGTIQQTAAITSVLRLPGTPGYQPVANATGLGTTNKVPKWVDDFGALGDSNISEVGGKVGIGTMTPGGQLHVFGGATNDVFSGMGPDLVNGPAMNYGYAGFSFGRGAGFFNVRPDALAGVPNPSLRFATNNVQRIIITNLGNVGIGTGFTLATAPTEKLEIAGNVKLLSSGRLVFPDATSMGTAGATLGANTYSGDQNVSGKVIATSNISSGGVVSGASGSFTGNIISTAGSVGAATQFNLGAERVLTLGGGVNQLFIGQSAGAANSTAGSLVFVGPGAGAADSTGTRNVFVGLTAGGSTTSGSYNAMVGSLAGFNNTQGNYNAFFGDQAGLFNSTGASNSYFGQSAGIFQTGSDNSFFGAGAGAGQGGVSNGTNNVAFGVNTGLLLTSGSNNTFLGMTAGTVTTVENNNVAIGMNATPGAGVSNGTAIGYQSFVAQSNSVVIGAVKDQNGATVNTRVGIGTSTPSTDLEIRNNTASAIAPILTLKNANGLAGSSPTIDFATYEPLVNPPSARFRVFDNNFSAEMIFYTKVPGAAANALQERMRITNTGIVGINRPSPDATTMLDVNGNVKFGGNQNLTGNITVVGTSDLQGTVHLTALGSAGGTALCENASGLIALCSSSIRYKDSVENYRDGMSVLRQLRPVSFRWKADGKADLGFVAEEVEKIEPRLTVYNAAGQVEGVKYDRITALLVDALQQQQTQMDQERADLKKENADLRERLQRLERAVERLSHDN